MTEIDPRPDQPAEAPAPTGGKVSIWLNHKGERLWSVSVDIGTTHDQVDEAVDLAVEAAHRLERER